MASLKVLVQGLDRKTLVTLVKAERRNIEVKTGHVMKPAQVRAVKFYEEHLEKVQKKLNPADKWASKY